MRIDLCCEPGLMRIDLSDLLSELRPAAEVVEHDAVSDLALHTQGLRPDLVVLHGHLLAAAGSLELAALRDAGAPVVAVGSRDDMSLAEARGWTGVPAPFTDADLAAAVERALAKGGVRTAEAPPAPDAIAVPDHPRRPRD